MTHRLVLLLIGVSVFAGGCNLAPRYTRPDAPVPSDFPRGPAFPAAPENLDTAPASELPWRGFFTDERLRDVITLALENNRDLRIAALSIERARAVYGVRRSELLPTIDANAELYRERIPADLSGTGQRTTVEQYTVDLGVSSWELDFFGRIRNLSDAALEEFLATEQARRAVQIALVSETANAYLTLAADREALILAEGTLSTRRDAYDLVKRRLERGLVPELDLYRAQTQVDTARRSVAQYIQRVAQDENALDLLAGVPVSSDLFPENLAQVSPPRELSPGLSSTVLLDRPDIAAAEHRLKAANANIGAARAAFFPRISLTAAAGTASSDLSGLFESGSGTWRFAPSVVLPVFDPRTWSNIKVSEAEREIAVAEYERTIQASFKEVADALAVRGTVDQQLAAQESLVRAVEQTHRLSTIRYDKGIDSYLDVLDAQRSLYEAQQALISFQLSKLTNQVTLYAVLGGGGHPLNTSAESAVAPEQPMPAASDDAHK